MYKLKTTIDKCILNKVQRSQDILKDDEDCQGAVFGDFIRVVSEEMEHGLYTN